MSPYFMADFLIPKKSGEFFIPYTLPETNIAPKNEWLEYYFPIGKAYFQGRTVSFREGIYSK